MPTNWSDSDEMLYCQDEGKAFYLSIEAAKEALEQQGRCSE